MPTIGVEKEDFLRRTGRAKSITQEELENLFFDLGLELDDIEEENGKVRIRFFPSFLNSRDSAGKKRDSRTIGVRSEPLGIRTD